MITVSEYTYSNLTLINKSSQRATGPSINVCIHSSITWSVVNKFAKNTDAIEPRQLSRWAYVRFWSRISAFIEKRSSLTNQILQNDNRANVSFPPPHSHSIFFFFYFQSALQRQRRNRVWHFFYVFFFLQTMHSLLILAELSLTSDRQLDLLAPDFERWRLQRCFDE